MLKTNPLKNITQIILVATFLIIESCTEKAHTTNNVAYVKLYYASLSNKIQFKLEDSSRFWQNIYKNSISRNYNPHQASSYNEGIAKISFVFTDSVVWEKQYSIDCIRKFLFTTKEQYTINIIDSGSGEAVESICKEIGKFKKTYSGPKLVAPRINTPINQ